MKKIVEAFFPEILILSGKNNIDNWQYWRAGFIFIKLHYGLYWFIVTFLTEFYCKNIHCRTLFQFKMLMGDSFVHKKKLTFKRNRAKNIPQTNLNKIIFPINILLLIIFWKMTYSSGAVSTSKYWTSDHRILIKYIFKTSDQCSAMLCFFHDLMITEHFQLNCSK